MRSATKEKKKINFKLLVLGVIALLILNSMIKWRSLYGISPIENLVAYIWGGLSYFDQITNGAVYIEDNRQLFGLATFGTITGPIAYVLSLLFGIQTVPEQIIGKVTSSVIYISNTFTYNALCTALYPMWRDGREWGIAFGMFFYGFVCSFIERRVRTHMNSLNYLLYSSFASTVILSTQNYELMYMRFSVQIMLIILLTRCKEKKGR